MKKFEEKKFNIAKLKGISEKSIEEHLKLYSGYVKNANLILETDEDTRRFGFEYNGMRNHEIYFKSLEGGSSQLSNKDLLSAIESEWGSFETWCASFKALALTRGIGWAMLYYDRNEKRLLNTWVDEQHLGQLQDCALILGLDMWEHSFVADYQPSGKKQYVEDFFTNLNWKVIESFYISATK